MPLFYLYGMAEGLGLLVLSKAACCFFRMTSASFCFTTVLATAPAERPAVTTQG